jgi:NTP pyrophosphatase (non-canonical NTP hydrolase)
MTDATTTVAELRQLWATFVAERDWQQFHAPKNLVMALAAEAAELMEHFLWIDNDTSRKVTEQPAELERVADEMADVAGALFALCNVLDLDLSQAIERKMAKNAAKYPIDKIRGRFRLED